MDYRRKRNEDNSNSDDSPVYSRLFVVCDKSVTEDQLKDAFSKYGTIEDVKIPRDRNTGETKGVAYIKFDKTSEAANAVENMNGKLLPISSRPLKVMVACSRSGIQDDDNDKYKRLFINTSKKEGEGALDEHFGQFGQIESIQIQRDRDTGESKGFAYIKYRKFSQAALAYEGCDKKYRPIFARPKSYNQRQETAYEANLNELAAVSSNMNASLISVMGTRPRGFTNVHFMCAPFLKRYQVESLFDLVPGMVQCEFFVDLVGNFGKGTVHYNNPVSAAYAVEKLNKFEYPPGVKLFVKPDQYKFDSRQEQSFAKMPNIVNNLKNAIAATANSSAPDLAQLAEAIAEASKLIKMATGGVLEGKIPGSEDLNYCNVKLPPTKPLAHIDSPVAKRCFLVCKPQPPPQTVLKDVFCRFGDLIDVYTLPNKTVGYAKYATASAADEAISKLHGSEVCGVRMKVMEAEDEQPNKRTRYD